MRVQETLTKLEPEHAARSTRSSALSRSIQTPIRQTPEPQPAVRPITTPQRMAFAPMPFTPPNCSW
jgi:hypothetical protein